MFKELIFQGGVRQRDGTRRYRYTLKDSCFQHQFLTISDMSWHNDVVLKIVDIYESRHLNIVRNIAQFYQWAHNVHGIYVRGTVNDNIDYIDAVKPSMEYGKKYSELLRRFYLKHLIYSKF